MKIASIPRTIATAAAVAALGGVLLAAQSAQASHPAKSPYLSWNAKKHTATLNLTAGLTQTNHTLNFNGYTSGGMVISVPKGYKVKVIFTNKSTFPHSAVFTTFASKSSEGDHPIAFPGASSPDPVKGTAPGATDTFSFVAKRVGTYAIICEVGHHADAGMWDTFKVTKGKQPSVKLTAPATEATPTPTS